MKVEFLGCWPRISAAKLAATRTGPRFIIIPLLMNKLSGKVNIARLWCSSRATSGVI
jgi:hypothetical protein